MKGEIALLAALAAAGPARAGEPPGLPGLFARVAPTVVQVVGAGGIRGVPSRGSGVLIDPAGHVLTFDSIGLAENRIRVGLADGRELPAALVARDPEHALALLKVDAKEALPAAVLPPPGDRPGPGLLALLVAHPFRITGPGEPPAAHFGLVKARLRLDLRLRLSDFPVRDEVLLTDAPANPGAQGGGLFDLEGRLIGLVGRMVEAEETNTLVSYALPIDLVAPFLSRALGGEASASRPARPPAGPPPYLGLRLLELGLHRSPPAFVDAVAPGSPAARAGLRPDDLILELDGRPARTCREFHQEARRLVPGEPVKVLFKRGDRVLEAELVPRPAREAP